MNIIVNDLEENTILDLAALSKLSGGYKTYGNWKFKGSLASGIRRGSTHLSNYWQRKDRLFKRSGHQHSHKVITLHYVRRVTEWQKS